MSIEVRNPATGESVGSVEAAGPDEVRQIVARAREAQRGWAALSFRERAKIIRKFHDLVLDRQGQILDTIQSETGKARRDALGEVVTVAGTAHYYVKHGERHLKRQRRQAAVPLLTRAEVDYKPHGVVGLITPWNYPFILSVADALPALLAGNAVIVKPSELTPFSALLARDLLLSCGLDPSVFGLVMGRGDAGEELIQHVDYVGFTGGTATGRRVAVRASERLIPYSLELGGKNPMIILEGASLDDAVTGLLAGAFSNTGQTCISVERVYVQGTIYDEFVRRVVQQTRKLKIGFSRSWEIDVGSLISTTHADKVMTHIEGAVATGAQVLAGGNRRSDLGKTFIEPTILTDVASDAPLFRQETFGPVISLYRVRSADEAIELANDSEYGLNASIWAKDGTNAFRIARQLETGSAAINSTLLIYNSFDVPMGGVKQSGIGRRHGEHGILKYTQAQSIVSSISAGGGFDSMALRIRSERMARAIIAAMRWWGRF